MGTQLSLIENSPLPMATTVGPGHRLVCANAAFCELQGKAADDIIGYPILEAISGDDANDVLALLDGVYGGERSGFVNHLQYTDPGHLLHYKSYMAWGVSADDDDTDGLVIQVSDFSDPLAINQTAEEIHELNREIRHINEQLVINAVHQQTLAEIAAGSELRLRSLIQGLNAIVCEIDALTEKFTFVSDRAESFLGYPNTLWNEEGFWEQVIHPDDYEMVSTSFRQAGHAGAGLQYTFRAIAANGSEIWLRNIMTIVRDSDGRVTKRRCVIVDFTEQQSANFALTLELERNRGIAEALQYSILWHQPEKLFPGLTLAAFYEPTVGDALVGGDFFDAFRLPDQSVMLVVGDVTGKGLKAAARTVEVTFALRAFAHDFAGAAETVRRLNEFICDSHHDDDREKGNSLIVVSLIVINPINGATQVVSAGAERPLILRATGEAEEVDVRGIMLGVNRGASYTATDLSLDPGDKLIMTTDGITEARHDNVFFGNDHLLGVARLTADHRTPHDVGKTILEAARAFAGGRFTDDVCLLVVQRDHVGAVD